MRIARFLTGFAFTGAFYQPLLQSLKSRWRVKNNHRD